jgi:hypothetical protein
MASEQRIIGFRPEEVVTSEATRSVRLKWVIVVLDSAPTGLQANATVCVTAATVVAVPGLLGPEGSDAAGRTHAGLPWTGCTVLSATAEQLDAIQERARAHDEVFLADMPTAGQTNRVYDDYLAELSGTAPADIRPLAISLVGPRNAVDRLVKRLPLL